MFTGIKDCVTLNNGVKMPWLGFGVFQTNEGEEVIRSVKDAIDLGYRSIDTAKIYENEAGVGQAIKECGVSREELFITTKLWNSDQGYESTLKAFDESMKKLGLDYLDLYLIHWPVKGKDDLLKETWRAMEKLYKDGKIKAIGVSNFKERHLKLIMENFEVVPVLNQVEFHPHLVQKELREFCKSHNIAVQAWSPLMRGKALSEPEIIALGEKYSKSPAQVILRWDLQNGVMTIPKSVHRERIGQNADLYDFEISEEDMEKINRMDKGMRIGPDPDEVEF